MTTKSRTAPKARANSRRPKILTPEEIEAARERSRRPDGQVDAFRFLIETAQPYPRSSAKTR
jgi:hypothetical protein